MLKMVAKESKAGAKSITVRPICADDWSNIETLFGQKGACGGCWCMYWRLPRGGKLWEQSKGAPNKRAFKKLVTGGRVFGCLAFADSEPVGWCCVGPRGDFPRLERTRALNTEWTERTWSVTCFYIPSGWRNCGVATALLRGAIDLARQAGAKELEAYPVKPYGASGRIPAAFAWTGVPRIFEKLKFKNVTPPGHSRDILVKRFRGSL